MTAVEYGKNHSGFTSDRPASAAELRQRLYQGELFLFASTVESRQLADAAQQAIDDEFATHGDSRTAYQRLSTDEHFEISGRLRKQIYSQTEYHSIVGKLVASLGFDTNKTGVDPARLRIVQPNGHDNPAAAAMYYGHRDTWYANPQTMLTWWMPLHDVDESNSFCFFPDNFDQPVENDSEIFNFDDWVARDEKKLIGWQDKNTGLTARYPQLLEEPVGTQIPVRCRRGELLLFSGQHLHRTYKQTTDFTRFSLDFRTVDLSDQKSGREAANVDNRSTGSWIKKFQPIADLIQPKIGLQPATRIEPPARR